MSENRPEQTKRMKHSNRKTVMKLIRQFKTGSWTCITMRDPVQLGEYGRRELYSWEGMPLFQLDIRFNPPQTKAFVVENWQELEMPTIPS